MGKHRNTRPTELLWKQMVFIRSIMDRRNRSSARELVCLLLCLVALALQIAHRGEHLLLLLLPFHSVIPSDPTKVDITEVYKPTTKTVQDVKVYLSRFKDKLAAIVINVINDNHTNHKFKPRFKSLGQIN